MNVSSKRTITGIDSIWQTLSDMPMPELSKYIDYLGTTRSTIPFSDCGGVFAARPSFVRLVAKAVHEIRKKYEGKESRKEILARCKAKRQQMEDRVVNVGRAIGRPRSMGIYKRCQCCCNNNLLKHYKGDSKICDRCAYEKQVAKDFKWVMSSILPNMEPVISRYTL